MALSRDVKSLFLQILEDIPCPRSLTVAILLRHDEYGQLVDLTVDPVDFCTSDAYWRAKQATDLLRKVRDLPTGIDTRQKAVDGFFSSERKCAETNSRLSRYLHNGPFKPQEMRIADFFDDVKRLVKRVLGPVPEIPSGKFGGGSTFGDLGSYNTLPDKLSNNPQFTPNAWGVLSSYATTLWRRGERTSSLTYLPGGISRGVGPDPVCVPGNRFATVPKNAKTDRGIAVEPSLNVYYQLPVGRYLKDRLFKQGIDLRHGQNLHKRKAKEGSVDGSLATIDLSSASDTVASNLVKLLLPPEWWDYLAGLRSPVTLIDGLRFRLSKFSSMGNGFTFELETLIFWSLSRKALEWSGLPTTSLLAYGDDLIVPREGFRSVTAVLRYCGFEVNTSKSYSTGLFRESCGGDFFHGHAVSTATMEKVPNTPEEWVVLLNNLRRVDPFGCYFKKSRQAIMGQIPKHIRACKGPSVLGDLVIHSEQGWQTRYDPRTQIRYIRVWAPVGKTKSLLKWNRRVQIGSLLSGVPGSGLSPRGWVSGYRLKWVPYS